jgi:Raf kinase inhibitor-like YbhB/YbcL family protein
MLRFASAAILACLLSFAAEAQQYEGKSANLMSIVTVKPKDSTAKPIVVTSSAFKPGGAIPKDNSAYGANKPPQLSWSGAPKGVASYVLVFQDPDVAGDKPLTHWILGNLSGSTTSLAEGAPAPAGAFQGGAHGNAYAGPHPPSGLHHYYFEIFALDTKLNLKDGLKAEEIEGAMTEHVLASGALEGTYQGPGQ